jgi:hypothetical protein
MNNNSQNITAKPRLSGIENTTNLMNESSNEDRPNPTVNDIQREKNSI